MEEESFDNVEIARLLNEDYIAIKVDRERRPDIDSTYMIAVQLMNESAGWPMSSFLNPAGKTFWSGTYFPPETFSQLPQEISLAWVERRADIEGRALTIAAAVEEATRNTQATEAIDENVTERAIAEIWQRRDPGFGGIGRAPKFTQEPTYLFLLGHALRSGDSEIAAWLKFDLDAIANGGIHDHIRDGSCRTLRRCFTAKRNYCVFIPKRITCSASNVTNLLSRGLYLFWIEN
jgi:uncharacterized protein YyaL (SSP411 family)